MVSEAAAQMVNLFGFPFVWKHETQITDCATISMGLDYCNWL